MGSGGVQHWSCWSIPEIRYRDQYADFFFLDQLTFGIANWIPLTGRAQRARQVRAAEEMSETYVSDTSSTASTPSDAPTPSTASTPSNASTAYPLQSNRPSIITRSGPTNTNGGRANYRPLPPRIEPSVPSSASVIKKRKHTKEPNGSRAIRYFEGSSEEDDNGYISGDGSSSGESITNVPGNAKRQRTSTITTRSLAQTPVPDLAIENPLGSSPLAPALESSQHTTDDEPPHVDIPCITDPPRTETATTSADTTIGTGSKVAVTRAEAVVADTNAVATGARVILDSEVPAFLLSHGKGARQVNIFAYLNEIRDPHFRQLLFHYIRFEANQTSSVNGTLPTAKRPPEISQWTSRARPLHFPDFMKGKRTFQMFVDSVFEWWGLVQPTWRSFVRGRVCHEVNGGWDALRAPQINGLLNIVILAYWWVRTLDEVEPAGSSRVDYELFAEDVAWVLSKLST